MVDWHDIKKAFERDAQKAEEKFVADEQKLLKSIADYICSQKGMTTIQGYHPEDIMSFLEKPVSEIKACLGGDWLSTEDNDLETLIYSLAKKVKKSGNILPW